MKLPDTRIVHLAARRALGAVLLAVLLAAPVIPIVNSLWQTDTRCCANGICCCRPSKPSTGWSLKASCRCGGHDEHEAGLPTVLPAEIPACFVLTRPSRESPLAPRPDRMARDGYSPPPTHPPARPASRNL
jgi:hypothetical protein